MECQRKPAWDQTGTPDPWLIRLAGLNRQPRYRLDPREAETFVNNLTKALHVPAGVASLDQVKGDQVIVKLAPDPLWNSSKLAQEAGE
ncbi:hypothetical protein ACOMHN_034707 [Nucella lapillus]